MGNFSIESIKSEHNRNKDLTYFKAFVCHNDNHWFCIRKIGEKWYNLNSTNSLGPQIISDFYLAVFLDSI